MRKHPARQAGKMQHLRIPIARMDVHQPGGARQRVLAGRDPGKVESIEVRGHQETLGCVEQGRMMFRPVLKMKRRDDWQDLHTGTGGDAGVMCLERVHAALPARVTIGARLVDQPAALVDKREIHAPAIDGERADGRAVRRPAQAFAQTGSDCLDIPCRAVVQPHLVTGETVQFTDGEGIAGKLDQHGAAGTGAEIENQAACGVCVHCPLFPRIARGWQHGERFREGGIASRWKHKNARTAPRILRIMINLT